MDSCCNSADYGVVYTLMNFVTVHPTLAVLLCLGEVLTGLILLGWLAHMESKYPR